MRYLILLFIILTICSCQELGNSIKGRISQSTQQPTTQPVQQQEPQQVVEQTPWDGFMKFYNNYQNYLGHPEVEGIPYKIQYVTYNPSTNRVEIKMFGAKLFDSGGNTGSMEINLELKGTISSNGVLAGQLTGSKISKVPGDIYDKRIEQVDFELNIRFDPEGRAFRTDDNDIFIYHPNPK